MIQLEVQVNHIE